MSDQSYFQRAETAARAHPIIGAAFALDGAEWTVESTGGGCMAWQLRTFDGEAAIWICDDGNGLGHEGEPDYWLIGLHPDEHWNDQFGTDAPTLADALAIAHAIHAARAFALGFRPVSLNAGKVTL